MIGPVTVCQPIEYVKVTDQLTLMTDLHHSLM